MDRSPTTTMVTGANGFLGSHVARLLAECGKRVVAYDAVPPSQTIAFIHGSQRERIQYARGQVTDLSHLLGVIQHYGVSELVHAAGFVDVGGAIDQAYYTYDVNTLGSINVYEAARLAKLRRVVLISSNAVYRDLEYEPIDERHPVVSPESGCPVGHYAASKLAAEIIGLTYCTWNDVDFVALRMSSIYGFGMRIPLYLGPMVEAAVRGETCAFATGGSMPRDYTYVKDAARGVAAALQVPASHLKQRIFNVAGGATHTAAEVATIVKELIPEADITIGSELTKLEQADLRTRGALDCRKAKEILGYAPAYDLRPGIKDYIDSLRSYLGRKDISPC